MKLIVALVLCLLIAYSLAGVTTQVAPKTTKRVTPIVPKNRCICTSNYSPVCSISGRTYSNACFANCFKDPIKKNGICHDVKQIKKRACQTKPFGKHGQRKQCCSWIQEGKTKLNVICKWSGPAKYKFMMNRCYWKRKDKTTHQRYCCSWIRIQTGLKKVDQPKKCQYIGKPLQKTSKQGCIYKKFGKFGKRRYCCKNTKSCQKDGKCSTKISCSYKGSVHYSKIISVCKWLQQRDSKRRQCCQYLFKYTHPYKKSAAKKTLLKCKFVGSRILKVSQKNCSWRVFGKNSKRKRCCQWKKICNLSTCYLKNVNCKWIGCAQQKKIQKRCSKTNKGTVCCTIRKSCGCGKCKVTHKSCSCPKRNKTKRTTKTLTSKRVHVKCHWKLYNKNLKRRMCCTYEKSCQGKVCGKSKLVSCRFHGDVILNPTLKCTWKKLSPQHYRKYCCSKKCTKCATKCQYSGPFVIRRAKTSCHARRYFSKTATRNRCCSWTDVCVGKKKCIPVGIKCKWSGSVTRKFSQRQCRWTNNKLGKVQVQCCLWNHVCVGKVCKQKKKNCQFVGKMLSVKKGSSCRLRRVGKYALRKQCCVHKKACDGKKCTTRLLRCVNKGPIIAFKHIRKCKKTNGNKVCNSVVQRCTNNVCKVDSNTKTIYNKTCSKLKSGKRRCCRSIIKCINNKCGKKFTKCKISKAYFSQVGGETCRFKYFGKGKKRQHCCKTVRFCSPNATITSCHKKQTCKWVGPAKAIGNVYTKKQKRCSKNGNKNICCTELLKCNKFRCVPIKSSCHVVSNKKRTVIRHSKCSIRKGITVKTFGKSKFVHPFEGAWKLFSSKFGLVAVKNKKVGKTVRAVGFSIKVGSNTLEVLSSKYLLLNKNKLVSTKNYKLNNVMITSNKSTVDVKLAGEATIRATFGKNSIKVMTISVSKLTPQHKIGLCSSEEKMKQAKGLFVDSTCSASKVNQFVKVCHKNIACVLRRC